MDDFVRGRIIADALMFSVEDQDITYVRIDIGCESSDAMEIAGEDLMFISCTCGDSER